MIGFRHCDPRYPFLWEDDSQPPARWHGVGEGPAHYLADTPDGAWAEFLRHEEITELGDLATIRRAIWAVDFDPSDCDDVALSQSTLTGDESTYPDCREEARRIRQRGSKGVMARSAALKAGMAAGYHVVNGLRPADGRDGDVYVLFGARPDLTGWRVSSDARPHASLLDNVNLV